MRPETPASLSEGPGCLSFLKRCLARWLPWLRTNSSGPGSGEANASLSRSELLALLDAVEYGVVVVDRDLRPVLVSRCAREYLKNEPSVESGLSGAMGGQLKTLLAQCLRLNGPVSRDIPGMLRVQAAPLPGSGGLLAYAVLRDTSADLRTEERYRLVAGEVAHDLRAPTCAIECQVEELLDHPDCDAEYLRSRLVQILDECQQISLLAGDILDVTALGSGRAKLSLEQCRLEDAAADSIATLSGAAGRAGVTLVSELDSHTRAVLGDPVRIVQALTNMIANAINHTPSGGNITVHCEDAGDFVRLCVTDTGCGIDPANLERVWNRFVRAADRGPDRQGTGLGLTIVRRIALLHGGEAGASSAPGKGSTFWITLPKFRPGACAGASTC